VHRTNEGFTQPSPDPAPIASFTAGEHG